MSHLKPTNDFIFKKLFGETKNEYLLKDLLQSILTDIKIDAVTVNKDVSLDIFHVQFLFGLQIIMFLMKGPSMRKQC